jgi:uroporphyrin-III C-methyltransferase/precorrin-2 dehydrogenase/sirohydrochlorin ferrochelatase
MHSLPIFVRLAGKSVILIGTGPMADAKARLIERAGATIVDEADEKAALAFVAITEAPEADTAAARLKARGLLVNVVDRLDLSDFTMPAIVDRDPVLVAIGTGGASAGLAAALRQRLETVLPAGLGGVARALHRARDTFKARFPDFPDRRRAIAGLVAPGGPLDPLTDIVDPDARIAAAAAPASGTIEHVALRSADPDELTLRAARLLGLADRIYHDGQVPDALLDRARADAERIAAPAPALPLPGLSVALSWDAA